MPFQVTLASGKEIETTVGPGGLIGALKREIGEKLDQHPRCVEINYAGDILLDDDKIPDAEVTVVLVRLPWVGATPEKVKDLGGGEFEFATDRKYRPPSERKFNALCEVGFSSGTEYFEIEVVQGSGAFIGVTTKAGFLEGYKIKGLFFGGPGNLSNGSAGLRTQFGQEVKPGSVIGVTLDLTDDKSVGITFWEGDTCLGEAFKDCPRELGALVFPAVCAEQGDRFKLSLKRNPRKPKLVTPHPAIGSWDLQRLMVDGDLLNLDAALAIKGKGKGRGYAVDGEDMKGNIVMAITSRDMKLFKISLRLANTLMTSVSGIKKNAKVQSKGVEVTMADGKEELKVGMVAGTMVMAPPPLMDLEQHFCKVLPLITRWSIVAGSTLELRGGGVEMDFIHYDAPPTEPVSSALP
eukprot:Skav235649  [mRNA]  locus=scaffold358:689272:691310:+ [translate_table: standard]